MTKIKRPASGFCPGAGVFCIDKNRLLPIPDGVRKGMATVLIDRASCWIENGVCPRNILAVACSTGEMPGGGSIMFSARTKPHGGDFTFSARERYRAVRVSVLWRRKNCRVAETLCSSSKKDAAPRRLHIFIGERCRAGVRFRNGTGPETSRGRIKFYGGGGRRHGERGDDPRGRKGLARQGCLCLERAHLDLNGRMGRLDGGG